MSVEKKLTVSSGWSILAAGILAIIASIALMVWTIVSMTSYDGHEADMPTYLGVLLAVSIIALCIVWIPLSGLFTLQPGQARVCILFGDYKGTVRDEGFHWANPFFARNMAGNTGGLGIQLGSLGQSIKASTTSAVSTTISVRARTLNGEILKVNDKMGNPIEIANVVVWHVADTAKALFDVDNYEAYVATQAETALRHVASVYAYDHLEDASDATDSITLRSNIEEVSEALKRELTDRLSPAGVVVDDARLTHLAYAPEIAQAMLRRQQAEAVIAARKKIVEGAVSMVDMAVKELAEGGTIALDDERKATMASNLMVVLCGESEAKPIVNTGSLY